MPPTLSAGRPALLVCLLVAVGTSGCARGVDAPEPADPPGGVAVRTVRDAATGAELPRVTLPGRPEVERRVNADLDSLSAQLTCGDVGPETADTSFESRASVAYAADDVLSVSVHASYYCGTAYPTNDANLSATYDLTTGARVPFEALFRDYAADRATIAGVLQTSLYAAGVDPEAPADASCADVLSAESLAGTSFAYTLTGAGLSVQPEFPHVVEACAAEATVPYASVRAFAADGGVLARVADAQAAAPAGGPAGAAR